MSKSSNGSLSMAIVAGLRTPFCKVNGALQGASAADLATHAFRELLDRTRIRREEIDEVILGCAGPDAREANIARVAALRAGLPETTPAVTIMRNCASGMEAVAAAKQKLAAGEGDVFLVGGTESMSNFPLMMGPQMAFVFSACLLLFQNEASVVLANVLVHLPLWMQSPELVDGLLQPHALLLARVQTFILRTALAVSVNRLVVLILKTDSVMKAHVLPCLRS